MGGNCWIVLILEELDERMYRAETLVDKTFEYLKYIERNMFKMESSINQRLRMVSKKHAKNIPLRCKKRLTLRSKDV